MWWSDRLAMTASNEVLEGDAAELLAVGRFGIDRGHVVTGRREGARQLAAPAADLENAGRRRPQASEDERREVHR
jgi:hypothetical protein